MINKQICFSFFLSIFLLFDRHVFDVNGTGIFKVCVWVAVVNLLPKLERSGGGGNGWPVNECWSDLVVDNDRELALDIERLSSIFDDDDECDGGGKDDEWLKMGDVDDRLLRVFEVEDIGDWWDFMEGLRPFRRSLKRTF